MEDSLFAGALVDALKESHDFACDTPQLVLHYYLSVKNELTKTVKMSSHAKRLNKLHVIKDIEFCMGHSTYDVVPILKGNKLVRA